jgi:hypothetical protein
MHSTKIVVVTGDITMDWNLARINHRAGKEFIWNPDICTHASWQRGGAALLADLVETIASSSENLPQHNINIYQTAAPRQPVDPGDERYHHSHAIWSPIKDEGQVVWRVAEFLGIDHCPGNLDRDGLHFQQVVDEPERVDLLVLDDADLGFRDNEALWPKCLKDGSQRPWVILKMSKPVAKGPLWDHLIKNFPDRLVTITTVDDLRRTAVQISEGLSWERTAQDLTWELVHSPRIKAMSGCAHVVVSFGPAGAVVLTRISGTTEGPEKTGGELIDWKRQLVFDPKVIEGMWEAEHPGGVIGYTTCIVGGIVQKMLSASDDADILPGVQTGLEALRFLHKKGYANTGSDGRPHLVFPLKQVAQQLSTEPDNFALVDIQDPAHFLSAEPRGEGRAPLDGFWTILGDRYQGDLDRICEQIVLEGGEITLQDVPQGIFGFLFTVDRQEIESFRSIGTLAAEYLSQTRPKRPLSIGVFGAPGSGKSFGITQVANSLAPGRIKVLEFNLSQFRSMDELGDALHQVRDANLSGKFPLVFWDEFDTPLSGKPLGWLRYFLAPMQDGAFREGQIVHPIGRAIFVFAGGTSERMASFGDGLDEETFKGAKVPDFISRLKGFVNVLGPNPQQSENGDPSTSDPFCIIRRAILLRSILWLNARHLFQPVDGIQSPNIDKGVLRAFLKTRFFKHGIRSMESIVAMSQLAGKTKFERSSLPPEAQLDLHVDGQEFLALVQQLDLTKETLDKLAILFHKNFCSQLEKQEYEPSEVTDEKAKKHSSFKDFYDLPEDEQEQNRDTVRHIHSKLAASGYIMIPARSNEPAFEFPGTFLEAMAIMEHERWMAMKLAAGWQSARVTKKGKKLHADLVPWDELSDTAKGRDRDFVRAIPGILANAGYTVVELRPMKAGG